MPKRRISHHTTVHRGTLHFSSFQDECERAIEQRPRKREREGNKDFSIGYVRRRGNSNGAYLFCNNEGMKKGK